MALLSLTQVQMGLHGAVGEIGVHHGMFAIIVAHQARRGERVLAADLFNALQHLNVDGSGSGDLRKFLRNTARFGIPRDALDLHVGLSTALPLQYAQPLRLFSVDGGHTDAITSSDLAWAACNAMSGGIIMLDDWQHPGWPGVVAGAEKHWHCGARPLTPFAVLDGKVYFTTSKWFAKAYRDALMQDAFFGRRLALHGTVFGSEVLTKITGFFNITTRKDMASEWRRVVLRSAARTRDTRSEAGGAEVPAWNSRMAAEAALAKWLPPKPLVPLQDGLLKVMDGLWPQAR